MLVIGDRGSDVPPGFADQDTPFEPAFASTVDRPFGSVTCAADAPLAERAERPAPIPRNAATLSAPAAIRDRAAGCRRLRRGARVRSAIRPNLPVSSVTQGWRRGLRAGCAYAGSLLRAIGGPEVLTGSAGAARLGR